MWFFSLNIAVNRTFYTNYAHANKIFFIKTIANDIHSGGWCTPWAYGPIYRGPQKRIATIEVRHSMDSTKPGKVGDQNASSAGPRGQLGWAKRPALTGYLACLLGLHLFTPPCIANPHNRPLPLHASLHGWPHLAGLLF